MLRLVELRGIEPLTSAVRLLGSRERMPEICGFLKPEIAQMGANMAVCDTSAIPASTVRSPSLAGCRQRFVVEGKSASPSSNHDD